MNWLDIAILVVLALTFFMGFQMGILRAVALVAGVVVGLFLAGVYSAQVGSFLAKYISGALANWVGFAIILVGVMIAANILGRIAHKAVSLVFLGWIDKLAGAVLGVVVGALVLGTVLALAGTFPFFNLDEAVAGSGLAPVILQYVPVVLGLLPEEFDKVKDLVVI